MSRIHPTAVVHSSARLADGVEVGPYCVIGPDVTIDADTVLHNHVTVQALTSIGQRNQIYPFAVIGADPQDRKFNGEPATCEIGDDNKIREHVTIHRGTRNGGGVTRMGNGNLVMVAAHIAHDCWIEDNVCIANQVMLAGHVRVEESANIGGGAGVHHFTTIGAYAFVGGLARITKDVPPYMIVEGNPAEVRAVNSIAMTRGGYRHEHVEAVKDAFRRLYRMNGAAMADKLIELRSDYPDVPAIQRICWFLEASAEGVHGRALELRRPDDKRTVPAVAKR